SILRSDYYSGVATHPSGPDWAGNSRRAMTQAGLSAPITAGLLRCAFRTADHTPKCDPFRTRSSLDIESRYPKSDVDPPPQYALTRAGRHPVRRQAAQDRPA